MDSAQSQRLLPTLVHIQTHLDQDLSLEALASVSALSPNHFHRVFKEAVGETTRDYVERLRLERAAFFLRTGEASVIDVALATGFQSHEVFTRAFRRRYGVSPREFRQSPLTAMGGGSEHPSNQELTPPVSLSSVQIRDVGPLHLAFIRNIGPYEDVDPSLWSTVRTWLDARGVGGDRLLAGLGHDAPGITAPDKLRFDACITVPGPLTGDGVVGYQRFEPRTMAVVTFVGPLQRLPEAYATLGTAIGGLHGYRMVGLPVLEIYRVTEITLDYELTQTEIMLPIEPVVG